VHEIGVNNIKNPVPTTQKTHQFFSTNTSQVLLCVNITLYNTDFAVPMKIGGFALFLHDISKNAFHFSLLGN
jgi:hypothetical protein